MSPKRQFKMQLEDDHIERLKVVAKRFGRDTAQEVAEEILTAYFPVWLAVAEATGRAVDYQTRKILEADIKGKREVNGSNVEIIPDSGISFVSKIDLADETKRRTPIKKKAGIR